MAWWRHAQFAQPIYQRPAIALEALKMRLFEPQAWGQSTLIGVMSEVDAQLVKQATPGVPTALTPNGVDIDYFTPGEGQREPDSAIFMGDYKYFPNIDGILYFVKDILPLIRKHRPSFTLTLLGKDPTPELIALSEDPSSGVHVAGLVEDTRPYLTHATLFVCPLRSGSGTRFKLLEALACGCPVVTTTLGAEGLNPVNGRHMVLADTPLAFADAVRRLINDPQEAARLGRHGRNWVAERHGWKRSAALVADAWDRLIGSDEKTIFRRQDTVET
jgi:glycosyltransferase involved in cell wall biosynthesis